MYYRGTGLSVGAQDHVVFIVDDDRRIREALSELLSSFDMHAVAFGSAAEYMAYPKPDVAACLVLDVELPDINGLDLQSQIAGDNHPQVVFITGHGDIPSSVRAMKAGAVDFLLKPFGDQELLDAIAQALERDRRCVASRHERAGILKRYASLTLRERQVVEPIVRGLPNKQVAAALGISEVTVKVHRRHIMSKMGAASLAELVRMIERSSLPR
jgi:FixJ family two-component response regulator